MPEPVEITYRSDVTVDLVKSSAADTDVLWAARVSTLGEQAAETPACPHGSLPCRCAQRELTDRDKGLINYLMRDRHGCYDDETEVLTRAGWKAWPKVDGTEEFLTVNRATGVQEYQRALRVIHKPWDGEMVRLTGNSVDLLVTPDHKMLAAPRTHNGEQWAMHDAADFHQRSYRVPLSYGQWVGERSVGPDRLRLLGFFIGDGHMGTSIDFHLRRSRKVSYLEAAAEACGFAVTSNGDTYRVLADEDFRLLAKKCYDGERAKVVPPEVLDCSPEGLSALLEGLMASDGHVSNEGKQSYTTTSTVLRDQIQEIAAKIGTAATWRVQAMGEGHYGSKTVYQMTIYRSRNLRQRVGWTTKDRVRQVRREHYSGMVHCVTVPNGVVFVRRNGMPLWCGNSPFEHTSMTFFVSAPIFVFREFVRHRVGFSYNEESGRYRELQPVFYVPGEDRKLVQTGKPGAYTFVEGTEEQKSEVDGLLRENSHECYWMYRTLLDAGVAREVARMALPLNIYSSMYVTCNARSLMHFLGLRTTSKLAKTPSFPQREIEMVAEQMEVQWARLMPLTYEAFNANGRVAP